MYSGTKVKMDWETVIVVGEALSGKSTFSKRLASELGVKLGQTGSVIAGVKAHRETFLFGADYAQTLQDIAADKEKYRRELVWLGDLMTSVRADTLIESCVASGARVINGVRRHHEVEGRIGRGHRDIWVKIVRPGHTVLDNYELHQFEKYLPPSIERHVVTNDGSIEALELQAVALANMLKK